MYLDTWTGSLRGALFLALTSMQLSMIICTYHQSWEVHVDSKSSNILIEASRSLEAWYGLGMTFHDREMALAYQCLGSPIYPTKIESDPSIAGLPHLSSTTSCFPRRS